VDAVTFVDWPLMASLPSNITCSVHAASVVSNIFAATTLPANTTCGGHIWRSRKCSSGKVALCVDCSDPCTHSCVDSYFINPCGTQASSCMNPSYGYLRTLSVSMSPLTPPPTAVLTNFTVTSTAATFSVELSTSGSFYVGIFDALTPPTSNADIIAQNLQYNLLNGTEVLVSFTGLTPVRHYNVFVVTKAVTGATMSFSESLKTRMGVNTTCCRLLTFQLSSLSVVQGSSLAKGVTVSLSARPTHNITIWLSVNSTAGVYPLYPSSIIFSSLAKFSTSSSASILSVGTAAVGALQLSVAVTGPDASLYQVVFANGNKLKVIDSFTQPSPPSVQYTRFSSDGTSLLVGFSTQTNMAGISAKQFTCSRVLNFTGASLATCQWNTNTEISASLGPSASLVIGAYVRVVAGLIKATCPVGQDCSRWNTTASTPAVVTAPLSLVLPTVSLRSAGLVGVCDQIVLDSSSSKGSAGRSWASATFSVQSSSGSATAIKRFLDNSYKLSPPTPIPRTYLFATTFTFILTLCNFMGGCSSASTIVSVVDSSVPVVSIFGDPVSQIYRKSPLSIQADAYVASCNSSALQRTGISYAWTVTDATGALTSLTTISKQKTIFALASFSLSVNQIYTLSFTATIDSTFSSSSATVQVSVLQGAIVPLLSGGTARGIKANSGVTLDASASYDEDYGSTVTGAAAGLSFAWSCLTTAPTLLATCAVTFDSESSTSFLLLFAEVASVGTTSLITVTVFDATRSTTASAALTTLDTAAPIVSVTSSVSTKVNTADKLILLGSIKAESSTKCSWTVDDETVDLASIALSSTSKTVPLVSGSTFSFNLAIGSAVLVDDTQYLFELQCATLTGTKGFASFSVVTNGPPAPGLFSVSPATGTELKDLFTLAAFQWVDSDIPLSYAFGFLSVDGVLQQIQSQSKLNYGSTVLPAGLDSMNYTVSCSAVVYDSLDANISSVALVHVMKYTGSFDSLQSIISSQISSSLSGTVDSAKQAISSCSASLNSVSCVSAPNCSALYRKNCRSTANTCGTCLDGYVGDQGDGNTYCSFSTSENRRRLHNSNFGSGSLVDTAVSCSNDGDCGLFEVCSGMRCYAETKNCSDDCSGSGECIYINSESGMNVSSCTVGDPVCTAVCVCESGYSGSFCEYTTDQMTSKKANRQSLLQSLYNVTSSEDANAANIASWLASLVSLSQDKFELTFSSFKISLAIAEIICTEAVALEMDYSVIGTVLDVVDSLASRIAVTLYLPEFESDAMLASDHAQQVINLLTSFTEILFSGLIIDQRNIEYIYDNFQFVASVSSLNSDGSASLMPLSGPQTSLQRLYNSPASVNLSLTASGDSSAIKFTMVVVNAVVYGRNSEDISSNAVLLLTDNATICDSSSDCQFSIILPNTASQTYLSVGDEGNMHTETIFCEAGQVSSTFFNCPMGFNMTGDCDGIFAGWKNITCPYYVSYPVCAGIADGEINDFSSTCESVAYTAEVSVYDCSLSASSSFSFSDSRRGYDRRLSSAENWGALLGSATGVQFVTMMQFALESPTSFGNSFTPTSVPTSSPTHSQAGFNTLMRHYVIQIQTILMAVFIPVCLILLFLAVYLYVRRRGKMVNSAVGIENLNIDWKGIFADKDNGDSVNETENPQKQHTSSIDNINESSSSSSGHNRPKRPIKLQASVVTTSRKQSSRRLGTPSSSFRSPLNNVNSSPDPADLFAEFDEQINLNAELCKESNEIPKSEPARVKDLRTSSQQRALRQAELTYLRRLIREYKAENDRIESSITMSSYLATAFMPGPLNDSNSNSEEDIIFQQEQASPSVGDLLGDDRDAVRNFSRYFSESDLRNTIGSMSSDTRDASDSPILVVNGDGNGEPSDDVSAHATGRLRTMLEPPEQHDELTSIFDLGNGADDNITLFDATVDVDDRVLPYDPIGRSKQMPASKPISLNVGVSRAKGPPSPNLRGGTGSGKSSPKFRTSEKTAGNPDLVGAALGTTTNGPNFNAGASTLYRTSSQQLQQQHEIMLVRQEELKRLAALAPFPEGSGQLQLQRSPSKYAISSPNKVGSLAGRTDRTAASEAADSPVRAAAYQLERSPSAIGRRNRERAAGSKRMDVGASNLTSRSVDASGRENPGNEIVVTASARASAESSSRGINAGNAIRPTSASAAAGTSPTRRVDRRRLDLSQVPTPNLAPDMEQRLRRIGGVNIALPTSQRRPPLDQPDKAPPSAPAPFSGSPSSSALPRTPSSISRKRLDLSHLNIDSV
jgi:hypothetical protein